MFFLQGCWQYPLLELVTSLPLLSLQSRVTQSCGWHAHACV